MRYRRIRRTTERLLEPLSPEDCLVQSMPTGVSPVKWHFGHTSWFFEVVVLRAHFPRYKPFRPEPEFDRLFNSYYLSLGEPFDRRLRGVLARPTLEELWQHRRYVDEHMAELLEGFDRRGEEERRALWERVETALQHEQQHQQALLRDLKHALWSNPLRPAYLNNAEPEPGFEPVASPTPPSALPELEWLPFEEGLYEIGRPYDGEGFAYDNERPRHRVYLYGFGLASRPVTNGEYLEFLEAGGYARPELWLDRGWDLLRAEGWQAPLYWERVDRGKGERDWRVFTLRGVRPLDPREPVCHLSFYEADAYARWAGARLPTEAEWEVAVAAFASSSSDSKPPTIEGTFLESGLYHPRPLGPSERGPVRALGDVWEWTGSPYVPYPGYRRPEGPLGEHNAKFFFGGQMVLRGGSCLAPRDHVRVTYRNYYPPETRLEVSGLRLARSRPNERS